MLYMKSGCTQRWTAHIFRWEQQTENADQSKFLDWEDFATTFKTEFTPAHSDALAINCLESMAYYQKARPLDKYIDEFQDLIADSGYSDPKTIVVKFWRGLSAQIQNSVATMASVLGDTRFPLDLRPLYMFCPIDVDSGSLNSVQIYPLLDKPITTQRPFGLIIILFYFSYDFLIISPLYYLLSPLSLYLGL